MRRVAVLGVLAVLMFGRYSASHSHWRAVAADQGGDSGDDSGDDDGDES